LKTREVLKLFDKLEMKIRIVLWTKVPHKKGDIKGKLQYFIRQQLKLNEKEFQDLVKCIIWRKDYIEILKKKGFLNLQE